MIRTIHQNKSCLSRISVFRHPNDQGAEKNDEYPGLTNKPNENVEHSERWAISRAYRSLTNMPWCVCV